jgi:hypothetical protein
MLMSLQRAGVKKLQILHFGLVIKSSIFELQVILEPSTDKKETTMWGIF